MTKTILDVLIKNSLLYSNKPAIWVNNKYYSYKSLFSISYNLSQEFLKAYPKQTFCALYSDRSIYCYQSIIASMMSENAYLPLNPAFPIKQNIEMIKLARPKIICIDTSKLENIQSLLSSIPKCNIFVFRKPLFELLNSFNLSHKISFFQNNILCPSQTNLQIAPDSKAYFLFTSGSTGKPKAITINHINLLTYIDSIYTLYKPTSDDRFLHFNELTFDISVHEMFLAWYSGGTLFVAPENNIIQLPQFVKDNQITYWMSVPSLITFLQQCKLLESKNFLSLKQSFFCGEPLFQDQAKIWQDSAPYSRITNLYGPTEATVAFTNFNWNKNLNDNQHDIVPIGKPLFNQKCILVKDKKTDDFAELYLAGSQLANGYYHNKKQSKEKFLQIESNLIHSNITHITKSQLYARTNHKYMYFQQAGFQSMAPIDSTCICYKTGDLVKWNDNFGLIFIGRIDDQWQIRGVRVEKCEIESKWKKLASTNLLAAVPLKNSVGFIESFVLFICKEINQSIILKKARKILPEILIPKKIIKISMLPKNKNGKIDYQILNKIAKENILDIGNKNA